MIDDRMCDHLNHKDACDKCTIEKLSHYKEMWQKIGGRANLEHLIKENEQLKAELERLEIENKEIKRYLQIHHAEMKQLKAELDTLRKLAGEYKLALDRRWV